jgi:enamine deaminase RidA (YjgF/YER057c/UK114 family)
MGTRRAAELVWCRWMGTIAVSYPRPLPIDATPLNPTPIAGAVRCGSRVFLSGRSALQPDGSVAGLGDAAAQTHVALDSIAAALQADGGSLRDISPG